MNELYWKTISPVMRDILASFGQSRLSGDFYLAGGTALALQLGHRLSADLDFFSPTQEISSLVEPLRATFQPFSTTLASIAWGNLIYLVSEVRVGFYGYGYDLVEPLEDAEGVGLASVTDIGLMKLDALLGRASRKDFHDLYAICQRIPLRSLLDLAPLKYPFVRDFETQAVQHLVFFDRARTGDAHSAAGNGRMGNC